MDMVNVSTISIIMLASLGLISMITVKGLGYFWPQPAIYYATSSQSDNLGQLGLQVANKPINEQAENGVVHYQYLLKTFPKSEGRAEYHWLTGLPSEFTKPVNATVIERTSGLQHLGFIDDEKDHSSSSTVKQISSDQIRLTTLAGDALLIPVSEVVDYYQPNNMSIFAKLGYFFTTSPAL